MCKNHEKPLHHLMVIFICIVIVVAITLIINDKFKKVETVTDFIFLGPKITVDGYCSPKIKRHLLFGR